MDKGRTGMEGYSNEEFGKMKEDSYGSDEDEYLNTIELLDYDDENICQTRELLEITEDGYENEEDFSQNFVVYKKITNEEEMLSVIHKAEREEWEELFLDIRGCVDIPVEIGALKKLKRFVIDNKNKSVIHIPSEIGGLTNLEKFSAYGCNIETLPEEFSKLTNLKVINLNDNSFEEFPKVILHLENLESLAINAKFDRLPDEICNMSHLKYLYMPHAGIEFLPENIGNLKELEILCIWGTKVKRLPESCLRLSKLKSLYLTKSIFKDILPPEIVNQSPVEAINYIIRFQNGTQKIEVNESKMIIVGQGGVGKTCLLNRLIYNKYDETVSTEGIDIDPWRFSVNNKEYKLNVWDFGGQEIYHATHQFFLTNRSLYIFVWDARQEEEYGRIDYWLHTIESFAYNSPIIIVINKCDSRNSIKQLDLKSLKEKFPQIIDSFKVSCKENIGIDYLRNTIEEETTKLPLMGMVWLSSWLDVRMELEKIAKSKNMIKYSEYLEICLKYKIQADEALSLSKYLHDLGIIINFQNDLYLKNIVILNPDWGTNAVYKVLDAQETVLKNRNGILYYEDLSKIWKDTAEYPREIYPIILRLMENFQLSFEVSKNKEYLIAELLENEEVMFELDIKDKQILNFQYNYEFLPAGIMTRFIVKANAYLIEKNGKKACWKKGAYLKYGDSIGLIKLLDGIAERRIEIKIYGANNRNNRDLLVIIRKYFEEIHNSVPKIKYTEYVKCDCRPKCSYLHDYRYLLRLERHCIESVRCQESLQEVNVSKLLDGVDDKKERNNMESEFIPNIQISPRIVVENKNTNSGENNNTNSIQNEVTVEVRNSINELQGCINDLKDEVADEQLELERELKKLEKSAEKLNDVRTKDEIVKSGVLNKMKRFLEEAQNPESEIGKVIKGIKYGVGIVQEIGEKYNKMAEWCGLPVIPGFFLNQ